MKIVVLDGHTLNPGDLSWSQLQALGEVTIHPRTSPDQVVCRATGAQALLTNKVVLGARELDSLPSLRYIGVLATGYNVVDTVAAKAHKVVVTNVPAYSTASVAQMVFSHILNLAQRVGAHSNSVIQGRWTSSPDFCFWDSPQVELAGKTLGIVGLGRIGETTARIGQAFGMRVIAHVRTPRSLPAGIAPVGLEELFRTSDVLSLHCPLTAETQGLINRERLAWMKPSAFLINTGRGGLIHEVDLAEALRTGRIAGAGLDVLSTEPPNPDNPLLTAPNCFITPHIAWATQEARSRLMSTAVSNLVAFQNGNPVNIVNP